ncbi:twin-arginine translocation pathway signal [Luminiphilus syltensis NOR5-1B]|uniref:Twin-arginine translocation pathway signal n=1 Tax=Luminiphilus syltensis NOR5-1B TaxID=565045 RepID=B8KVN3_9GAMM|nr:NAD(P)/FAD-dependent oxidoreductase [Luminiphilus syltensis]EED36596.1 twin-arginine translocation pathway signal [Luminiphilus syltensis NOR5-1B]
MSNKITRRDFLDGIALSVAGAALAPFASRAQTSTVRPGTAAYYPPILTGMRGSHDGSYEVAHALAREGKRPVAYQRIDEEFDLVVVGAGISGLAAAYAYGKRAGTGAKILVLDNHDDFGGHAKRNEFHIKGRMLLSFGGSINLEEAAMSEAAHGLLEEIGIDFEALQHAGPDNYLLSNGTAPYGLYLSEAQYGKPQLINEAWAKALLDEGDVTAAIESLNIPASDKPALVSLISGDSNFLPGLDIAELDHYLHQTSYAQFLTEKVGLSPLGARLYEPIIRAIFGVGIEAVSVSEALKLGAPGLYSVGLPDSMVAPDDPESENAARNPMFPDGNASVARLLVRKLIPSIASGDSMTDIAAAKFDYSQLDADTSLVRIRLNSTAVHAVNVDGDVVDVSYVTEGKAYTVRGRRCILAGYNGMIPHLCPELPEVQKGNLTYGVKAPFIWANVLLKSGAAIRQGGASVYQCPGSFFELVSHAPPVTLGDYQPPDDQEEPMVCFMGHVPTPEGDPGQSARELYRLGRHRILATPFSDYESEIRAQLDGMFGQFGFNANTDIAAITVNRWSHGYAYEYLDLHDPKWEPGQAPHEIGRRPIGRISIANSDSEAYAYVHAAIDAALRSVNEVLG